MSVSSEQSPNFTLSEVNLSLVNKLAMSLDFKKATCHISPKLFKLSSGVSISYIENYFNATIASSSFPDSLKWASITPVLKKVTQLALRTTGL